MSTTLIRKLLSVSDASSILAEIVVELCDRIDDLESRLDGVPLPMYPSGKRYGDLVREA